MVDTSQPDPAKIASLAQQIVKVLAGSDSATRARTIDAVMTMLGEPSLNRISRPSDARVETDEPEIPPDLATFFQRDGKLKPSDHAFLAAAFHYSLYGTAAFSLTELREVAQNAGAVLPDRLDMTLRNAGKGGKKLFQHAGMGSYKPTAAAGVYFKEKWGVRPGRRSKPKKVSN